MSIELYKKEYDVLDEKRTRVMIAKACKSFSSNSNKLSKVHISPVTKEVCNGYNMEETHSSDKCINLVLSKSYSKNQHKAMQEEIKSKAKEKLIILDFTEDAESQAFKAALEFLANS